MNILVLNLGSTSFKFKLYQLDDSEQIIASGTVENIGSPSSAYKLSLAGQVEAGDCSCPVHGDAMDFCLTALLKSQVIRSLDDLDAVGYKAAHGGPIRGAQLVNDHLMGIMDDFASFAPAHNPVYVQTMRTIRSRYPDLCQVAYFETSFHATIPDYRVTYGVPYEWQNDYGIRRYGFHGSSHSYIASQIKELDPAAKKVVSLHLGGSSSLCAVQDGVSIAESMGATPQSGVFHNNRVGDLDVFCIPDLIKRFNGNSDEVFKQLATRGGFLGISGVSNDLRDIHKAIEQGNERAKLSIDAFVDALVGYVGMFTAYLGGLDALVFTGGIGQHDSVIRENTCKALAFLGVNLDEAKNAGKGDRSIHSDMSQVSVWVLETNEELMVARQVRNLLQPVVQV